MAPNQPRTPAMAFRIPEDLQNAVRAKASERGETVTSVVIAAFERYAKRPSPKAPEEIS